MASPDFASCSRKDLKRKANDIEYATETISTPTKQDVREDGHCSTPVKRRLNFNFWKSKPQEKEPLETTIAELTDRNFFNKTIYFRVLFKSEMKDTKIGKFFSFHGMDNSGKIAIVSFRDEAEKFNDIIRINSVYKMENFNVKVEDKNYPSGSDHVFQITLNASSVVTKEEDDTKVPAIPFNFMAINEIGDLPVKSKVDVLGIIVKDWGAENTTKGTLKRDLIITDKTKENVVLTVWGAKTNSFIQEYSAVAIRNAYVSNYGGITSLNCYNDTLVWIDPDIEQSGELRGWFLNELEKLEG